MTDSSSPRPAVVTRRQRRTITRRPTVFVGVDGSATVAGILADVDETTRRVFLVGPRPSGHGHELAAWAAGPLPPGWAADPGGHYLDLDAPVLRYTSPQGGRIEVLRAAQWFGGQTSLEAAAAAWDALDDELRATFGGGCLSTPGTTGADLLLRSLGGGAWLVLEPELQAWLRSATGQGRTQILPAPDCVDIHWFDVPRDVAVVDGRLMYGALCWKLPAGTPRRYDPARFSVYARGRYEVVVTVPRTWERECICGAPGHARIGVAPLKAAGGAWSYPAEPGETFTTVLDGAELLVAQRHGWQTTIVGGWTWDHETSPLDTWVGRLRRRYLDHAGEGPLAYAYRAIILHTIGRLHGAPRTITRTAPLAEARRVPRGARALRADGDELVWTETEPNRWPALCHPEWSTTIWARARARLLEAPHETGALHVAAVTVVAFSTDALYLTAEPAWPDDATIGAWRTKESRRCARWPAHWTDLRGAS